VFGGEVVGDAGVARGRVESGHTRVLETVFTIIVEFVHVLQYLWNAAGCVHPNNDQAAEQWVHRQATKILEGHARMAKPPNGPPSAARNAARTTRSADVGDDTGDDEWPKTNAQRHREAREARS
jgi:hypothetical protein